MEFSTEKATVFVLLSSSLFAFVLYGGYLFFETILLLIRATLSFLHVHSRGHPDLSRGTTCVGVAYISSFIVNKLVSIGTSTFYGKYLYDIQIYFLVY